MPPCAHQIKGGIKEGSVLTCRWSVGSEFIGYPVGIVTGIGAANANGMSTVSDPHPLAEHPLPDLLLVSYQVELSCCLHKGRSPINDRF